MSQFHFRPVDRATFAPTKATKTDLARGTGLFLGLNCFEPGQSQPIHSHRGLDKFYLILSGKANMAVGDDRFDAESGDLIWAPADVPHGVVTAIERTTMLVGMGPPPG